MALKKPQYAKFIIITLVLACIFLFLFQRKIEPFADFKNEKGETIDISTTESEEQKQAEQYIEPDSVVLELGARYGTVSCIINKKLNNKYNQVSVEPDSRVWHALESNKAANGCKFNILKGFVSKTNLEVVGEGYGATFKESSSTQSKSYTVEDIEEQYDLKFNTLVADCEGCLEKLFDENPKFYKNLRLVLFEKDYPDKCNYNKIIEKFKANGFKQIVDGFHSVWKKDYESSNIFAAGQYS